LDLIDKEDLIKEKMAYLLI